MWSHVTWGSYLDLPRLTFTGWVHVDVATMNNSPCNFDINRPELILPPSEWNWNTNGTGEFKLFNCFVTSALTTNPLDIPDAIIDSKVVSNFNMPYAKIVDLDVQHQLSSEIYGLHLAIVRSNGDIAFQARAETMPLVQDMWTRRICNLSLADRNMGSKAVTVLTGITWGNTAGSPVLQEFKALTAKSHRNLSITFNVFNFNEVGQNLATLVGAIGVAFENESLHFAGERLMTHHDVEQISLPLSIDDACSEASGTHPPWIFKAPFHINKNALRLSVDFGNSLTTNVYGTLRNIGEIWLGVQSGMDNGCIHTIGDPIPYMETNWHSVGNIVDRILNKKQYRLLLSSPLLVVRTAIDYGVTILSQHHPIGHGSFGSSHSRSEILHSCANNALLLQVMLKEPTHFLRPMRQYLGRMEYMQEMILQLKLTRYGKPVEDETVTVAQDEVTSSIPIAGVVSTSSSAKTNEHGLVSFTFQVNKKIASPRLLPQRVRCNNITITQAPIEGQVYFFNYSTSKTQCHTNANLGSNGFIVSMNRIAILAFSFFEEPEDPNWIDHVQPIFKQYEQLFPVMNDFIHLGNYTEVTITHNRLMLDFTMSIDINHPNYMPVTRDLSPTKRNMILKWLRQKPKPMFSRDRFSYGLRIQSPRCTACHVKDEVKDSYYQNLYIRRQFQRRELIRPLFKYGVLGTRAGKRATDSLCTVEVLKQQLQLAINLELATIPPYLTSMYSIVQGHNVEIYKRIRSVVMQEMQHMIQAANILIAIGGKPMIDSKEHAPSYPGSLPGGVLPNLRITLEKLSKQHVYEVLMGIEVPHNISLDSDNPEIFNDTIGQFYKEIQVCIEDLKDKDIFSDESLVNKQMEWPWDAPSVGTVVIIKDHATAIEAVQGIMNQGEGASPLDPSVGSSAVGPPFLAHFYNFEEIVCQKHLALDEDGRFCYSGDPIPFDPTGVWPMLPNLDKNKIPAFSRCYIAARNFHGAWRALLRKLQEVFDGNIGGMMDSIALMHTLAVHGHKVMQINIEGTEENCGPVWDYEWN
ncbi:hypothetical protein EMCRGX_G028138 [Ephydatia muelleri]